MPATLLPKHLLKLKFQIMNNNSYDKRETAQGLFAILTFISFFLPWVNWDGFTVTGSGLPAGTFFETAEKTGGPSNPFPQFSLGLYIFWLVPVLAALSVVLIVLKKHKAIVSFLTAGLGLALVTVYILFSATLLDLGIGSSLTSMLQPALYLHIIAATGLVITATGPKHFGVKLAWFLAGPLLAFGGYSIGEYFIMNETYVATRDVKTDYTINAADLLKEFAGNDTATNKKYLDKTLLVKGNVAAVKIATDSSSTLQFEDSTGSYIIFSLEKNEWNQVKNIKAGDAVSLKGVCSGSIFSEILGTTSVTFKRATLQ
jgi:tRNA_anti-like